MAGSAPVFGIGKYDQTFPDTNTTNYETAGTGTATYAKSANIGRDDANHYMRVEEDPNNIGFPNIYADLTDATAATINQLRLAFATQKFLEIQARGGSRYIEVIKNHFNVTSPDARLQRPEFLGSGSSPVNITP